MSFDKIRNKLAIFCILLAVSSVVFMNLKLYSFEKNLRSTTLDNSLVLKHTKNALLKGGSPTFVIISNREDENKQIQLERSLFFAGAEFITIELFETLEPELIKKQFSALVQEKGEDAVLALIAIGRAQECVPKLLADFDEISAAIFTSPTGEIDTKYPLNKPTLVITTTTDTTSTPEGAARIYNLFTGDDIMSNGRAFHAEKSGVTLEVVSKVYLSYQPYNNDYFEKISNWFSINLDYDGKESYILKNGTDTAFIFISIVSLLATLLLVNWESVNQKSEPSYRILTMTVISSVTFFLFRAVIWVLSLIIVAIVAFFAWYLPFLQLSTGLVFVINISISGLVLILIYQKGKMPGTEGKLNIRFAMPTKASGIAGIFLVVFVYLAIVLSAVSSGVIGLEINLSSLITAACYAVFLFFGFYAFAYEKIVLGDTGISTLTKVLYGLSLYLPLVVIALVSIPIGNYTWMFQSFIYIAMLAVILAMHRPLHRFTDSELSTAIIQCVLYGSFIALIKI